MQERSAPYHLLDSKPFPGMSTPDIVLYLMIGYAHPYGGTVGGIVVAPYSAIPTFLLN